jgi:hypothetical protein
MENIGYRWLQDAFNLSVVQPLAIESRIGKTRTTVIGIDAVRHETYPEPYRPGVTLPEQLTFALRYEGIHLEFLSRLFSLPAVRQELEAWARHEPTGAYSRRACFLCEWLHPGTPLNVPSVFQGNYVDALNPDEFVVGAAVNNSRWRVRDNLPGSVDYCPIIRRTDLVKRAEAYDIREKIAELEADFGVDLLLRSAVWLTVKESRASFQIEREQDKDDRVRRFASVMESECGMHDDPLAAESLATLQKGILGEAALRYGPRMSPVYVGHDAHYRAVVDYVAPHWNQTQGLLSGLAHFMERTRGVSPITRAAVVSFGFVYIHPMADGNGRISRFLINDILRRDNVVPKPIILPVSATIAESAVSRAGYDTILERFSKPLMSSYAEDYRFDKPVVGDDGVEYNFLFTKYGEALPAWRYQDLTAHVEYLAEIIDLTLTHEMHKEASFLRANDSARAGIKSFLEAPDNDLDAIIRSVRQNNHALSNSLLKRYPVLAGPMGERVVSTIVEAFEDVAFQPSR